MFDVLIKGVSDKALGALVAKIGTKPYSVRVTHYLHANQEQPPATVEIPTAARRRINAGDFLALGPNDARENSQIWHAKVALENLENHYGIGTVTRAMLTEKLEGKRSKVDAPGSTISSALKHGLIAGVANRG